MVRAVLIGITLLGLAGCNAHTGTPVAGDGTPTASTSSQQGAGATQPGEKQRSAGRGGPRTPAMMNLDPNQLLNTEQAAVTTLLGRPGYERREQDAKVWQYRSGRCVLDVFMYRESSDWRVAYFEFRSPDAGPVSEDACFEMFVRENAATVES
jgi:hypothetical protein